MEIIKRRTHTINNMDVSELYRVNSNDAAIIIDEYLNTLTQVPDRVVLGKNRAVLKELLEFMSIRGFSNPFFPLKLTINFRDMTKQEIYEAITQLNIMKNRLLFRRWVFERTQVAFIAHKMALDFIEFSNLFSEEYIHHLPLKGDFYLKLFSLNTEEVRNYRRVSEILRPKEEEVVLRTKERKSRIIKKRRVLVNNSVTRRIMAYLYAKYGIDRLAEDLFKYYMFLSPRERIKGRVFPGITPYPEIALLDFLRKWEKIPKSIKILNDKFNKEKEYGSLKIPGVLFGCAVAYLNGVSLDMLSEMTSVPKEKIIESVAIFEPVSDRAKRFLEGVK